MTSFRFIQKDGSSKAKRRFFLLLAVVLSTLLVVGASYIVASQERRVFEQFRRDSTFDSAIISITYFDGRSYREAREVRITDREELSAIWQLCRNATLRAGKHTGPYSYTIDITFMKPGFHQVVNLYKDSGDSYFVGFLGKTISISGEDPGGLVEELSRRYLPSTPDMIGQ